MGLKGDAAIVGIAEYTPERRYSGRPMFDLEQWAELSAWALADAGLTSRDVNGIVTSRIRESPHFVPATVAEYCGWSVNLAENVDLGGANSVGAVWRAAAAIELGLCDVVVAAVVNRPPPLQPEGAVDPFVARQYAFGASSAEWGSPQAEFELPFGHIAQNSGYAMIAQRYGALYGYDERAMAKIVVDQRTNACANPEAVFFGKPVTIDDVLSSKMIADPLRLLEIVMPVAGGAAVVIASREVARRTRHRPVFITGCGEHLAHKTPTYTSDMLHTPIGPAADTAFAMAGVARSDVDVAQLYDCYTITVLLTIEDSGFCAKGEGMAFVRDHDLTYRGDFPVNTHGGQLGFGQAGGAGGMSQVVEAARQVRGEAGVRQVPGCDTAYVSGTGGVMSEQAALIVQGG